MADVSVRTIQRIETSGTASLETTRALASALSVSSDQLLATSPEYRSLAATLHPHHSGHGQFANYVILNTENGCTVRSNYPNVPNQ